MTVAGAAGQRLTPSETAYFHATEFARDKTLLDGADLIHTERKVRASDLADAVLAAALLGAEDAGALRLVVDKKSKLFGLRKVDALYAEGTGAPHGFPKESFEAQLAEMAQGGRKEVHRMVVDLLREDAPSPDLWTLQLLLHGLQERGLLGSGERRVLKVMRVATVEMTPQAEALAAATPAAPVRALLERAEKERPQVRALMRDAVKSALKFRREVSDDDPDYD